MTKELMKFSNNEKAVILNTDSKLDGIEVTVIGVAFDFPEATTYIIRRNDTLMFDNGFQAILMTEHCLHHNNAP